MQLLPQIKVSQNPSNLLDSVLIYLNFLIQKLTYDKYQYHTRVTCKLCVPNTQRISGNQNFQIKFCYHANNNKNNNMNNDHSTTYDDFASEHTDSVHNHNLLSYPKLCARHRVPSVCSSEGVHNHKRYRSRNTSSTGNQTADLNDFMSTSKLRSRRKRTFSRQSEHLDKINSTLTNKQHRISNRKSSEKLSLEEESLNNLKTNSESSVRVTKHSKVHFHLNEEDAEEVKLTPKEEVTITEIPLDIQKTGTVCVFKTSNSKTDYLISNLTDDIKSANQLSCLPKPTTNLKSLNMSSSSSVNNEEAKLGWDSYWDKLELNVLGNINT